MITEREIESNTMETEPQAKRTNQSTGLNVTLEPTKNDSDGVDIRLTGRLTIEHVTEIHDKIEIAMVQFTNVNLILDSVEELDLSVIQLFFYFSKTAEEDENNLTISHELKSDITDLLDKTGLQIEPNIDK